MSVMLDMPLSTLSVPLTLNHFMLSSMVKNGRSITQLRFVIYAMQDIKELLNWLIILDTPKFSIKKTEN